MQGKKGLNFLATTLKLFNIRLFNQTIIDSKCKKERKKVLPNRQVLIPNFQQNMWGGRDRHKNKLAVKNI